MSNSYNYVDPDYTNTDPGQHKVEVSHKAISGQPDEFGQARA